MKCISEDNIIENTNGRTVKKIENARPETTNGRLKTFHSLRHGYRHHVNTHTNVLFAVLNIIDLIIRCWESNVYNMWSGICTVYCSNITLISWLFPRVNKYFIQRLICWNLTSRTEYDEKYNGNTDSTMCGTDGTDFIVLSIIPCSSSLVLRIWIFLLTPGPHWIHYVTYVNWLGLFALRDSPVLWFCPTIYY